MHVVAVLAGHVAGQRLIDASGRHVHQPFLGFDDLDALHQQIGLHDHVPGHVKDDAGLGAVVGAAVDFRAFFIIRAEHIQRDRGGKLAFSVLLADFDVGRVELPVSVFLDDPEQVADDLFLPGEQVEGLS